MSELKLTIKDLDDLKAHLSDAVGAKIDAKLDQVTQAVSGFSGRVHAVEAAQDTQHTRLSKLEGNQAKALAAWTAMIAGLMTGLTLGFNYIKAWTFGHFKP
jgi:hypothetical protein